MKPRHIGAALAVVGAIAAGGAFAAGTAGLPAEQHQGNIAYVTGGVGKEQARAFRQAVGRYPLALEFVKRAGKIDEFLAGIKVEVTDHGGKTVLATETEGPFLLARMPSGRYTVAATYDGKTLKHPVVVKRSAARPIVFEWKQNA
jgi:hypothetical protein